MDQIYPVISNTKIWKNKNSYSKLFRVLKIETEYKIETSIVKPYYCLRLKFNLVKNLSFDTNLVSFSLSLNFACHLKLLVVNAKS